MILKAQLWQNIIQSFSHVLMYWLCREETDLALVFPDVTAKVMENTLNLLRVGTLQETLDPQQLSEARELCQDLKLPEFIVAGMITHYILVTFFCL